jgi:hypothetical protein
MSVKVAIAALASYELSHECRSRQLLCQPRILAVPFIKCSLIANTARFSNLTVSWCDLEAHERR